MSAADAIHDRIHGPGYCDPPCGLCREVSGLLDDYAHELAEEIRNSDELRDFTDDHMSDCNAAADLIDPEVQ